MQSQNESSFHIILQRDMTSGHWHMQSIQHTLAALELTICDWSQDGNAYLFVVSANDKQWSKSQSKLRKLQESFRA